MPHPKELLGVRLVLWRNAQGAWSCFEDRCPHRLAPLSGSKPDLDPSMGCATLLTIAWCSLLCGPLLFCIKCKSFLFGLKKFRQPHISLNSPTNLAWFINSTSRLALI